MRSSETIAASGRSRSAAAKFSRKCASEDVPGISNTFGARRSSHASATCIGVAPSPAATADKSCDCSGVNPPSGKKRHIRDTRCAKFVNQRIVLAVHHIIEVLHAHDVRDAPPIRHLPGCRIAQPDMPHQTLPLQFGQSGQWRLEIALRRPVHARTSIAN